MIDKYPVIMITGPRQVGKSTLLSYISRKLDRKIKVHAQNLWNDSFLYNNYVETDY